MLQKPINIRLENCFEQRAIKERQLKFQSMQIDVLEMPVELLALIVEKQEETNVSSQIISLKARQLLAHSPSHNLHRVIEHARVKQFRRNLRGLGLYELIDD